MRWVPQLWLCQGCVLICLLWGVLGELGNPYKILGVHRRATQQDIRKAYKQLAKEWHPDKSSDIHAEERFVEIKQAYELLSDPDRRKRYDNKGITEDDFYNKPEHPPFHSSNPLDDLFAQHGARFNFQENDITFFSQIIYYYKPNLGRRLSIHTLPCLVLLLDGNIFVYKETITSVQRIVEFIRSKMPYKMVSRIKTDDIDNFLNGWEDNRVRGLIFEPRYSMRLRYLVTAYHFRHRVAFGFVDSQEIRDRYQVPHDMDTVLLFNENTSYPMASVTMKDIPTSTLHHIISSNQYLALPRLSSQGVLEAVCPCEWNKPRKRLCVVLITEASHNHDFHRQSFRLYAQNSPYSAEKVRFAYIYHDKQTEFVNSLIPDSSRSLFSINRLEEENIQKQKAKVKSGNNNNDSSNSRYQPELRLHEMRSETYNALVMLLKPGCRTILLILDMESRQQLIPPFHKAVWPYRKNKTLMFSFMYIERGLTWYKELLQISLPEERELNINPRNCVGTVLALTGHRKYFCVFHAKHTEGARKGTKKAKKLDEKDCESGAFIGFDSDSSDNGEEVLLQESLLDGLPNWLDRLFEGTTKRYHINYWPEFPIK
ncbi:hypothetical protein NQ314_018969 [Rhamnusium bicolor]|uniref:J domain-containing protein n=1 Tax=Rhamnusium bicolor TaxID=1586634 RepID=A0AAV8WP06_9CUCU|nr:hypothetical protein NQ314_018969 [Rhamnusium bicolor]